MAKLAQPIEVKRADADKVGSCGACNRDDKEVFEVTIMTARFCLCRHCRLDLMEKLDNYA